MTLSRRFAAIAAAAGLTVSLGLAGFAQAQAPAKGQVPAKPQTKTTTPATPKGRPIDLNTATAEQMTETLPGVGEVTARKIIAGRPYRTLADLERAGVPARTIEAIRPLVVVSAPASTATPPTTKAMTKGAATPKAIPGATIPATPAGLVDINTATVEQLQELPGIGPVAAQAIVAGRPYRTVNDLEKVRGIGEARIAALRNLVTVGPPRGTTTSTTTRIPGPGGAMTKSVPTTKGATAAKTATTPGLGGLRPGQIVNINTAPKEQLDLLPGIGPVKAAAIIEGRPFKTKEDIMKVKGIKEGEFARIRDLITVD